MLLTLLGLAAAVSAILTFISSRILRGRQATARSPVIVAACLPFISAGYLFICAFLAFPLLIPGETEFLFGDILEPLPNGYALKAMGKMSDYGSIVATSEARPLPKLKSTVCSIYVEDPIVFGKYRRPFGQDEDITCRATKDISL